MHDGEKTYAHIRVVNQRAQETDPDGSPPRTWNKLDRFVGGGSTLYVLGLRCPIRLVMIDSELRYAANALRENPVPRLKLTLYHEELGTPVWGEMFPPELAATLTHLTLCLSYIKAYLPTPPQQSITDADAIPQVRWDDVLGSLISGLRPLRRLTHLRAVIGVHAQATQDTPRPFLPQEEYAHTFRPSTLDSEGTASALALALPSLQHVFLTTGGYFSNCRKDKWNLYERWYVGHGWRVARPGSDEVQGSEEYSLVELHNHQKGGTCPLEARRDDTPFGLWVAHVSAASVRVTCNGTTASFPQA